jgi:hypothetical protein
LQGSGIDLHGFCCPVTDSFLALRATKSQFDHVPVFTYFRFRKSPAEKKYIDSEERNGKRYKYKYDDKQLKHDQNVDNL